MSCTSCVYAKPLAFAVYCKRDAELRNLPDSIGHIIGQPRIQARPPAWCPLAKPDTHCTSCGEVLSLYSHCALCTSRS